MVLQTGLHLSKWTRLRFVFGNGLIWFLVWSDFCPTELPSRRPKDPAPELWNQDSLQGPWLSTRFLFPLAFPFPPR